MYFLFGFHQFWIYRRHKNLAFLKKQSNVTFVKTQSDYLIIPRIGRRIAVARESKSLSQAELAKKLGFKDRQTLASIEAGERKVTIEEMLALLEITGLEMDFFTDPLRLVGEGGFSYRCSEPEEAELEPFQEQIGRCLALWRHLGEKRGEKPGLIRPKLSLNLDSTFEDAQNAGEAMGQYLDLGTVPAEKLVTAVEQTLKIPVFFVEMPKGVSGVAAQIPGADSILIHRRESLGRQTFDIAHELFHVLTWDAMPPERVDRKNPSSTKAKKVEQLADNFAAALLMPSDLFCQKWDKLPDEVCVASKVVSLAEHFCVSPPAVVWRLVALGKLKNKQARELIPELPSFSVIEKAPFSRMFFERLAWAVDRGEVSVRKTLKILGIDLETAINYARIHGVALEIGM
jgi:Zn-dependent peptidase ImmA (M78 family)/transcriptional regulator with XRE-family HTH domain